MGDKCIIAAIEEFEFGIKEVKCRQFADSNTHQLWRNHIFYPKGFEPNIMTHLKKEMDSVKQEVSTKVRTDIAIYANQQMRAEEAINYNFKPITTETDILLINGDALFKSIPEDIIKSVVFKSNLSAIERQKLLNQLNSDSIKLLNLITESENLQLNAKYCDQLIACGRTISVKINNNQNVMTPQVFII